MTTRLKVALLYLGRRGGIPNHTIAMASGLQDHCDLTCYFAANCVARERMEALSSPVNFYPFYHGWPSFIRSTIDGNSLRTIGSAIEKQAPDFVIDMGSALWGDLLYRRRISRRVQWGRMIHDVVLHEGNNIAGRIGRLLFPPAADIMIVVSKFSARQLQDRYPGQRIVTSRIGVIHGATERSPESIASRRKHFLFFGRIEKYKGVEVLVDAYSRAKSVDPELRLVIAGMGELAQGVKTRIRELGIEFVNEFIPDEKVPDFFSEAGVLVLPYLSATQSGVAAAGLANGLPMIATDVGGLPEHVLNGQTGRIVSPGDAAQLASAMLEISGSESLARAMSHETLQMGKTFGWDQIAQDLLRDLAATQHPCGFTEEPRAESA